MAWNGDSALPASLSVTCGAFSAVPGLGNHFLLELARDHVPDELCSQERARALMCATISAWDPAWSVIASDSLRRIQQREPGQPFIGWMTYLSQWQPGPKITSIASIGAAGKNGSIIVLAADCNMATPALAQQVAIEVGSLNQESPAR